MVAETEKYFFLLLCFSLLKTEPGKGINFVGTNSFRCRKEKKLVRSKSEYSFKFFFVQNFVLYH